MNSRAIVKTSKMLKDSMTLAGLHMDAVQRAREIFQAGMKRLEAEYADRIKRAAAIFTNPESPAADNAAPEQPASEPSPLDNLPPLDGGPHVSS